MSGWAIVRHRSFRESNITANLTSRKIRWGCCITILEDICPETWKSQPRLISTGEKWGDRSTRPSMPNRTVLIPSRASIKERDVTVKMGSILDGVSDHMKDYPDHRTFLPSDEAPVDVAEELTSNRVEILLNYLPVGSTQAAHYYARCCLETGTSLINCMPVFIVSDPSGPSGLRPRESPASATTSNPKWAPPLFIGH